MKLSPEVMGSELARGLGNGPGAERLAAQRAALVARIGELEHAGVLVEPGRAAHRRAWARLESMFGNLGSVGWQRWAAAGCALGLVLLVGLLSPLSSNLRSASWAWGSAAGASEAPIATLVGGETVPVGSWLQATGATEVKIAFSEGTELALGADSRARLQRLERDEVVVVLEAGVLHSSVIPETGVGWTIEAGPYRVHVVGTVFDVVWNADSQLLEVDVTRGKVRVSGGQLGEGQPVRAGMRLESSLRDGVVKLVDRAQALAASDLSTTRSRVDEAPGQAAEDKSEPNAGPLSAGEPVQVETASAEANRVPLQRRGPGVERQLASAPKTDESPGLVAPDGWRERLAAGDYAGAVAAAEQQGFHDLVQTVGAGELLQLGDAARLSGNAHRAQQAYSGLRQRFAGSSQAVLGAYSLGRLAVDVRGDHGQAVRWFRTYLREGPRTGQVAAGARARLMDSLLRLGDRSGAKQVARDYLQYHPAGKHRALAQQLVSSENIE